MSINTELMQQVVAHLNANKEFKEKSEKLIKYDNQVNKISKVGNAFIGTFVGGTGVAVAGAMVSFSEQYGQYDMPMLMGGLGVFAAGLMGETICEQLKAHIRSKSVDVYNDVYSQVGESYIAKVNESNQNYSEDDYLNDLGEYQRENEKVFNIADFDNESDCME